MKKIIIFSTTYFPFVGGAEVAVKEITDRLPEISFHLITLRVDKRLPLVEKIGNVTVHRIGFAGGSSRERPHFGFPWTLNKYIFPFLACRKAKKLHRKEKFDAMWAIMAAYAGLAAMFFKREHPTVPYILTLQEGTPLSDIKRKGAFIKGWFESVFIKATVVQTISTYLASFARSMGVKKDIVVIPNGVDVAHFSKEYSFYELEKLEMSLSSASTSVKDNKEAILMEPSFVITISRLVEKNGVADLIASLQYLPPHVFLVVVGEGPLSVPLRDKASHLGVAERVFFVGHVDHKDMPKYLAVSNVFVRPSLSEGFGNAFVEAMAAGVPVVATSVGGIPDFLFDPFVTKDKEPTGLFCEVKNPKSIADKVSLLLEDNDLRTMIIKNAKALVQKEYDWNFIAQRMKKEVFLKVMK